MSRRLPALVLVLASLYFVARGPVRFLISEDWSDTTVAYCNARAWISGQNPYLTESLQRFAHGAASKETREGSFSMPSSIPLFSLIAWLPWSASKTAFVILACVTMIGAILALIRRFGISGDNRFYFTAFVLSLAPIHTAFGIGNVSAVLIPAIVLCWLWDERGWGIAAGLLLGIGLCFKPQLFLPLALFFLTPRGDMVWQQRLRPLVTAGVVWIVSTAVFVFLAVPGWWTAFHSRLELISKGDANDFVLSNVGRYELLNFQVIPATFGVSRNTCNLIAVGIAITLFVIWWRSERALAPLLLLSFVPFYHRFYEAGVLMLVLAASFAYGGRLLRWLCVPFLLPLPTILYLFVPVHNPWWNALVLGHEVWLIITIVVISVVGYGSGIEKTRLRDGQMQVHSGAPISA